jgi:hypothetical protein
MALAIIRGDWYDVGVQLRNIVDTMWDGIKNAFNIAKEALLRIIRELVNNMKWNFTDIDWGAVGRGVIDGIVGGVRAAAGGLAQAAADAARAALDAAKGFLGIRSPSKVTANLIGKPFAEGIFKGIEDATRVLERTKMRTLWRQSRAAPMQMQPVASHPQWSATHRSTTCTSRPVRRPRTSSRTLPFCKHSRGRGYAGLDVGSTE